MKTRHQLPVAAMIMAALAFAGCGEKKDAAADRAKEAPAVTADHPHPEGTAPHSHDSGTTAAPAASDVRTYTFHGTVTKMDQDAGMITIDHEKIGDFMGAMEMAFKVGDPAIFQKLAVGRKTHFTLRVAGTEMLITGVEDGHAPGTEH